MIEKERIVSTPEDVFWAIELLKQGKSVLCHPVWAQFLEFQARMHGIKVKIQGNAFVYEFSPVKEEDDE